MRKLYLLIPILFLIYWGCGKKQERPVLNLNKENLYDELLNMGGSYVYNDFLDTNKNYLSYKIKFEPDYRFSKYFSPPFVKIDYRWILETEGKVEIITKENEKFIGMKLIGDNNSLFEYTVGVKTDSGYRPHIYPFVINPEYEIFEDRLDSINRLQGWGKNSEEIYSYNNPSLEETRLKMSFIKNYLLEEYHIEDIISKSYFDDSSSSTKNLYYDKYYGKLVTGKVYGYFGKDKNNLKKKYFGNIVIGEIEGNWIEWYNNGQKWIEGTYKDGKEDGLFTEWYNNGQKWIEGTYKDGKVDGLVTKWYNNGQKKKEGTVMDGKENGKWTYWDENGQKSKEITYKDGNLVKIKWNEDGSEKKVEEH